jgi:hypothetical protein
MKNEERAKVVSYLVARVLLKDAQRILQGESLSTLSETLQKEIEYDMVLRGDVDRARELGKRRKEKMAFDDKCISELKEIQVLT